MKYEVTAKITVDADSPAEAVKLFDSEYRDTYNVVNLHAALVVADWSTGATHGARGTTQQAQGVRRNGHTIAHQSDRVIPKAWCSRCGAWFDDYRTPSCECAGDPPVDGDRAAYNARVDRLRHEGLTAADCTCYYDCRQDSHSGDWHVHEGEPCPVHPEATVVG